MIVVAATLESVFALCLGCKIFAMLDAHRRDPGVGVRGVQRHLGALRLTNAFSRAYSAGLHR